MATTTFTIDDDQYRLVQDSANFRGQAVSTFIKEAVMQRVEDDLDYREALAVTQASEGTLSREEVLAELGFDDV